MIQTTLNYNNNNYFTQFSHSSDPIVPPNPVVVPAALATILVDHNSSDSNIMTHDY